ncbi:hypothetical protein GCM10027162_21750 [Streptomyces incanus]
MSATPLLVCTRTTGYRLPATGYRLPATGYRHESIPAGVAALRALGGFDIDATEDPAAFEEPLDGRKEFPRVPPRCLPPA